MPKKRMADTLLEMEIISQADHDKAVQEQQGSGRPISQILEAMGACTEEEIAKALANKFGFPFVKDLARFKFKREVLDTIDAETALAKTIFPLKIDGNKLHLAMTNPLDMELQSDLSFKIGLNISPCAAAAKEIKAAIEKNYLVEVESDEDDLLWTILIVDDQDIVLSAAEAALKKEGYTVYKAQNGADGLKKAIQIKPHLIVTDVLMPRMDGQEMFRALKANQSVAHIPVIALSAKAAAEEEYRLLEMGFYDFVPKPINPVRLAARVRRAMRMSHGAHQ